jgi:NADH dehydrogenase
MATDSSVTATAPPGARAGTRARVVIVGAGFGGLECARELDRAAVDVLLLDRSGYHLFTPLLYQVATALLDPARSPTRCARCSGSPRTSASGPPR